MGTDMSRIKWHNQFDLRWPWKFQVNKRNLRYGKSLKWWDSHYTLFVSIEEYYEIAYCLSREGMKTLAFLHPGCRNSKKQQYLPILRAKAFNSLHLDWRRLDVSILLTEWLFHSHATTQLLNKYLSHDDVCHIFMQSYLSKSQPEKWTF